MRLVPGLECAVTDGQWTLTVAMGAKSGGTNAGPNPGVLARGALGSCLALNYAMWAIRLDVPIETLEVDVEADYDSRGELGVSDEVPPGYTQVRYRVAIASPASDSDVRNLIEMADKHCAVLDVFSRALDVRRDIQLVRPSHPADAQR